MVVKPDAIIRFKLVSSGGDFAQLCNDIVNMVLHSHSLISLQAMSTANEP